MEVKTFIQNHLIAAYGKVIARVDNGEVVGTDIYTTEPVEAFEEIDAPAPDASNETQEA